MTNPERGANPPEPSRGQTRTNRERGKPEPPSEGKPRPGTPEPGEDRAGERGANPNRLREGQTPAGLLRSNLVGGANPSRAWSQAPPPLIPFRYSNIIGKAVGFYKSVGFLIYRSVNVPYGFIAFFRGKKRRGDNLPSAVGSSSFLKNEHRPFTPKP